ncbi:MAG: GGDEF domain-containing protein, partial [Kordiimonadaceae bacterium]|nr:GGDEF domain-containing protein [Kordiimonadaceae bacterium]
LHHIAQMLQQHVRGTDVIGRLGGDEFGVILAQADEATGAQKAQELATMIAKHPLELEGESIRMSLAFGTYTFRSGDEPQDALHKADQAMYENKKVVKAENDEKDASDNEDTP